MVGDSQADRVANVVRLIDARLQLLHPIDATARDGVGGMDRALAMLRRWIQTTTDSLREGGLHPHTLAFGEVRVPVKDGDVAGSIFEMLSAYGRALVDLKTQLRDDPDILQRDGSRPVASPSQATGPTQVQPANNQATDGAHLLASIEELRAGLIHYSQQQLGSRQAEGFRSELASLWGEIEEDVAALNVPLEWLARGSSAEVLRFPTFQLALRPGPFDSVTRDSIRHAIQSLETARGRLRKRKNAGAHGKTAEGAPVAAERTPKVFVVHGHDEALLQSVARLLEKLGLEPVVLKEQPNRGSRALIEKFEAESSSASYAIVLLTPDDVGGKAPSVADKAPPIRPRARQNVVLELGYFMGALGRENVCPLYSGDLELPSDYGGVAYTKADSGWEFKLANELHAAGFDVDLNRLRSPKGK